MYIKEKYNKGITLIALVITIIVLLILGGTSISLVVGNNGVLTQASNAVIKNREASAKEEIELAVASCESDYWTAWAKDSGVDISNYFKKEKLQQYVTGTIENVTDQGVDGSFQITYRKEEVDYTFNVDGNRKVTLANEGIASSAEENSGTTGEQNSENESESGNTVSAGETATGGNKIYSDGTDTAVIPEFWTVSGFSDEQKIANGLVIYDLREANVTWTEENRSTIQENYNQYVWVPVSLSSTATSMPRFDGYYDGSKDEVYIAADGYCTEPYEDGDSTESSEYVDMVASVKLNGGFYVGRYEASYNSDYGTVESKKGKTPWTNIKWGDSMDDVGGSGAVVKARYYSNNPGVRTSTLIYGCQWDAILNWIDPNFSTGSCVTTGENKSVLVDSTGKGYYDAPSKTNTGYYEIKNIYDMAGNVSEWTMEADGEDFRVIRGGSYESDGLTDPVSVRSSSSPNSASDDFGFRVAFYL